MVTDTAAVTVHPRVCDVRSVLLGGEDVSEHGSQTRHHERVTGGPSTAVAADERVVGEPGCGAADDREVLHALNMGRRNLCDNPTSRFGGSTERRPV